jgi:type VI secretion system secreted protein VgrG
MLRKAWFAVIAGFVVLGALALPAGSAQAVTVSHAQLEGGVLSLDGMNAAPGIFVMVTSTSSFAGARSSYSSAGSFHVQAANFRADDCKVVVSDGQTLNQTVSLSGCTPTPVKPAGANPPPTGTCVITPRAPATFHVGALSTYYFATTGCDTATDTVQWVFLAGRIPVGMSGPTSQGQTAGAVSGTPTTPGTSTFRVKVIDSAGATDTETFTIDVAP